MRKGDFLGEGQSKRVFRLDDAASKKVIGEFRENLSEAEVKSIFYLYKLAKLFFPDNIPDVSLAANKDGQSYTVMEEAERDPQHITANILFNKTDATNNEKNIYHNYYNERSKNPRVREFLHESSKKGFLFDSSPRNFSFNEKGDVVHLDLEPAFRGTNVVNFSPDRLEQSIQELPSGQRKLAQTYFERLMTLYKQARA